jgi:hypothetical protein
MKQYLYTLHKAVPGPQGPGHEGRYVLFYKKDETCVDGEEESRGEQDQGRYRTRVEPVHRQHQAMSSPHAHPQAHAA